MPSISNVADMAIGQIKPNPRNARTHSNKQIASIVANIREFGFTSPVLLDENSTLIAGHGRLAAAKSIGLHSIPAVVVSGLTEKQQRKLMLSDNAIATKAGWDRELLAIEIHDLIIDDPEMIIGGFDAAEIDELMAAFEDNSTDPADSSPAVSQSLVSRRGDLWVLGKHKLLCGDARAPGDLACLMGDEVAAMAFLDPPYNVRVADIVGRGSIKHDEFAMASGEMSSEEFRDFLSLTLTNAGRVSKDSAVHFVCMDWRNVENLLAVGRMVYPAFLNLVVWAKSSPGQGSFYRSQHELIGVFRVGETPHLNNIELGKHGRNRSNVWQYAGVNSFGKSRLEELASHPTVKPVALVADAIKDCTKRSDIVLDSFGGSGTTMLACERVGRRARLVEYEPQYVDVAIRRWQAFTGSDAISAETGRTFDETAALAKETA